MATHAIKAGEGDVFVAGGVETVSRFAKGMSDGMPDTHNPRFIKLANLREIAIVIGKPPRHIPSEFYLGG